MKHFYLSLIQIQIKSPPSTDRCLSVHFLLPYKWEEFDGVTWELLPDMEDIERAFCDPAQTQRSGVKGWGQGSGVSGEAVTETILLPCLQRWRSARQLPVNDSAVAARPASIHRFLGNEAATLHPDHRVALVLPGGRGPLAGVRTAGEISCFSEISSY